MDMILVNALLMICGFVAGWFVCRLVLMLRALRVLRGNYVSPSQELVALAKEVGVKYRGQR